MIVSQEISVILSYESSRIFGEPVKPQDCGKT